jgi:hypothetical protein
LYYCSFSNFGDELNKVIFEELFGLRFNYVTNPYMADYFAIGSILSWFNISTWKELILEIITWFLRGRKLTKVIVLGSGFHRDYKKYKYLRRMDFRIVRGKLTERILRENNLLQKKIIHGDLGILSSYLITKMPEKKYKLGIIPHMNDLNSPIFYDIYKKHFPSCITINVQDHPKKVIEDIASCENIISSSLHGLIASDSLNIPNLWVESRFTPGPEPHFKYLDYYSIYEINDIEPLQAIDFLDFDIGNIKRRYRIDYDIVKQKQKELFDYCKHFFNDSFA